MNEVLKKNCKRLTLYSAACVIALVVAFLGCSRSKKLQQTATNQFAQESAVADFVHFQYALYLLPGTSSKANPEITLRDALNGFPSLKWVETLADQPDGMFIHSFLQKDVQHKYAPPDLRFLEHFGHGISNEQKHALQSSNRVLILNFAHPKQQIWPALKTADTLVEEVGRKTNA